VRLLLWEDQLEGRLVDQHAHVRRVRGGEMDERKLVVDIKSPAGEGTEVNECSVRDI
jgi:hypothetical protein